MFVAALWKINLSKPPTTVLKQIFLDFPMVLFWYLGSTMLFLISFFHFLKNRERREFLLFFPYPPYLIWHSRSGRIVTTI
jgi:hypothetical protein